MITQSSKNVTLTFEQTQQIDETQARLSNLENEIMVARKELNALKNDTARITKEHDYQQSLLDEVAPKVSEAQQHLITLQSSRDNINDEIYVLVEAKKAHTKDMETREQVVQVKESDLNARIAAHVEQSAALQRNIAAHQEEVQSLKEKKEKLQEVLNLF